MIKFCNTVAPKVITKAKTVGFLKTDGAVGAIYFLLCLSCVCLMLETKQLANTQIPPTPQKI